MAATTLSCVFLRLLISSTVRVLIQGTIHISLDREVGEGRSGVGERENSMNKFRSLRYGSTNFGSPERFSLILSSFLLGTYFCHPGLVTSLGL